MSTSVSGGSLGITVISATCLRYYSPKYRAFSPNWSKNNLHISRMSFTYATSSVFSHRWFNHDVHVVLKIWYFLFGYELQLLNRHMYHVIYPFLSVFVIHPINRPVGHESKPSSLGYLMLAVDIKNTPKNKIQKPRTFEDYWQQKFNNRWKMTQIIKDAWPHVEAK